MAKFKMELPEEVLKDLQYVDRNYTKIFGGMTKAGAKVVYSNVVSNAPSELKRNKDVMNKLKISKVYKTPSDDGINSKVLFSGYFMYRRKNKRKADVLVKTPVPLVVNMFEYGTSDGKYPKKPFFRKSFKKAQIEKAMLKAQKEISGGLLDE